MPLQLGDVSTERSQVITFDPANKAEVEDAAKKMRELLDKGFVLKSRGLSKISLDPPPRDPNLGVFRILSQNGDDRIVWDRTKPSEVREAFAKFKELLKKGYQAYVSLSSGKKGHRIEDFDPGLEEIILVPSTVPG